MSGRVGAGIHVKAHHPVDPGGDVRLPIRDHAVGLSHPAGTRRQRLHLNIPRYVDTFEEEAEIDLKSVKKEIVTPEKELTAGRAKMDGYIKELGV